jgi:hypothetical protein
MSTSTEKTVPKQVDALIRRFSDSAQATSDIAGEVGRHRVVLDYDRVAARFYEDLIMRLRKELQRYRAQAQFAFHFESTGGGAVLVPGEPATVSRDFRNKMNRFVEEAESTPEEL